MKPIIFLTLLFLAGCAVGPDYVRPETETPAVFKEAQPFLKEWQQIDSSKPFFVADRWWQVFKDPVLDKLQEQLQIDNQNIRIAEAQYRAARAALDNANSAFYPTLGVDLGRVRAAKNSENTLINTNSLVASASWEIDLWGRIRRESESAEARLEAGAADLAGARLSAQALLTQTYIQLRGAEAQQAMLQATIVIYTQALEVARNRRLVGIASPLEISNAESQLASAKASALSAELQRVQYEHALAVLVGKIPAQLALTTTAELPKLPATPPLVPSLWLASRPDIIAAERRVAAANAQIGVAQAAWYPSLTLGAQYGYSSNVFSSLVSTPHSFWSLGPILGMTLFDGGRRSAAVASASASYDESVASYRQTVLTAFQEVEDNLAAARLIAEEMLEREVAAKSARRSREIAGYQYQAGTSSQLELIVLQASALNAERTLIETRQRQLLATVQLYKNLAGAPVAPEKTENLQP